MESLGREDYTFTQDSDEPKEKATKNQRKIITTKLKLSSATKNALKVNSLSDTEKGNETSKRISKTNGKIEDSSNNSSSENGDKILDPKKKSQGKKSAKTKHVEKNVNPKQEIWRSVNSRHELDKTTQKKKLQDKKISSESSVESDNYSNNASSEVSNNVFSPKIKPYGKSTFKATYVNKNGGSGQEISKNVNLHNESGKTTEYDRAESIKISEKKLQKLKSAKQLNVPMNSSNVGSQGQDPKTNFCGNFTLLFLMFFNLLC